MDNNDEYIDELIKLIWKNASKRVMDKLENDKLKNT